jgi:hypothetical protein
LKKGLYIADGKEINVNSFEGKFASKKANCKTSVSLNGWKFVHQLSD